jgi:hypothetical protein
MLSHLLGHVGNPESRSEKRQLTETPDDCTIYLSRVMTWRDCNSGVLIRFSESPQMSALKVSVRLESLQRTAIRPDLGPDAVSRDGPLDMRLEASY